jgi:hypothetical protein
MLKCNTLQGLETLCLLYDYIRRSSNGWVKPAGLFIFNGLSIVLSSMAAFHVLIFPVLGPACRYFCCRQT